MPSLQGIEDALAKLQRRWQFSMSFAADFEAAFELASQGRRNADFQVSLIFGGVLYNLLLMLDYIFFPKHFGLCVDIRLGATVSAEPAQ